MARVKNYESIILNILRKYLEVEFLGTEVTLQLIVDKENKHYQIVMMGWQNNEFFHDCPIHLDIIDEKIWIQQNMSEWDFGALLEKEKVPKSDIILGYLSPATRAFSDYAIA
jgi:hypothetical protein